MKNNPLPKVILAGAGPGDVDLITVKTAQYLEKSAFVLVDRLVNPAIVQRYASPKAEIVYVGKHGGRESAKQALINALLVEYGNREGLTVRLKGGDVAFFSNVLDEINVLRQHAIPFELVPGITAASGAAASLNMPLTARLLARGVRFLTYQDQEQFSITDWQNLAETQDTLVFYMATQTLPLLIKRINAFIKIDKAILIIEQATTPQQRVLTASLQTFEEKLANTNIQQPALVVIGAVSGLYSGESEIELLTHSFFKEH